MRGARVGTFGVVIGSALALVGPVAPASAKPVERGEFHDVVSVELEDFCDEPGFTVQLEAVFDGTFTVQSKGPDGLLYFAQHLSFSQTITNPANGLSVLDTARILDKDLSVTDNGDGTLTVVILATGNATTYGPSGKAIARDPGQVRVELVVDHGGTPTDPSDDVVLSETQIKGSTGRSDDFCAAVVGAIG
jgi:hypothetical protein